MEKSPFITACCLLRDFFFFLLLGFLLFSENTLCYESQDLLNWEDLEMKHITIFVQFRSENGRIMMT